MKIMKGRKEKTENKRTYILMLLIVMLMLICIIAICVVGAHSVHPTETAELNKDVEQKEEHISAAVDIAATSIGTNAKATFTVSTGEIHIYNSSTSGKATMSKSSWYTFLKKIITADGNLDAVKSITFDDQVYAPANSVNLFSPYISETRYPLSKLVAFNNIDDKLLMSNVTDISNMFYGCSSLKSLNVYNWDMSKLESTMRVFSHCSALEKIRGFEYWRNGNNCTWGYGMFDGCSSLRELNIPYVDTGVHLSMFRGCSSLEVLKLKKEKPGVSVTGDRKF